MPERASTTQAQDSTYRSLGYLAAILLVVGVFGAGFLIARSSTRTVVVQLPASSQQLAPAPQGGSTVADQADAAPAPQPPVQAPAPAQPSSEAPAPVDTTSSSPPPTYQEPEPPQPPPEPTATPPEPYPQSAEEAAARFGGEPSEWTRAPDAPNGWVFRTNGSGDWPRFVVPEACLINQDGPNLHPGDAVYTSGFTIWFGVSS